MANNVVTPQDRMISLLEQQLLTVGRMLEFYTNGTLSNTANQEAEVVELQAIKASILSQIAIETAIVSGLNVIANKNLPYGANNGNLMVYQFYDGAILLKTVTMIYDANDNITSFIES